MANMGSIQLWMFEELELVCGWVWVVPRRWGLD